MCVADGIGKPSRRAANVDRLADDQPFRVVWDTRYRDRDEVVIHVTAQGEMIAFADYDGCGRRQFHDPVSEPGKRREMLVRFGTTGVG